jgi:hypothetical protein
MLVKLEGVIKGIDNSTTDTPRIYFKLIWLAMILSSFVFIEPSPYDVVFIICIVVGLSF